MPGLTSRPSAQPLLNDITSGVESGFSAHAGTQVACASGVLIRKYDVEGASEPLGGKLLEWEGRADTRLLDPPPPIGLVYKDGHNDRRQVRADRGPCGARAAVMYGGPATGQDRVVIEGSSDEQVIAQVPRVVVGPAGSPDDHAAVGGDACWSGSPCASLAGRSGDPRSY